MSVRREIRRDPKAGTTREFWFVDVTFEHSDGRLERVRKVSPVQTKRGAEQYERDIRQSLLEGPRKKEVERPAAPTFKVFADEFMSTYAATNNKPSEIATKRKNLKNHLVPAFGDLGIDAIGPQEIERFKTRKAVEGLSPKTVNNHLTLLRRILSIACEWGRLEHVPPVRWLKVPEQKIDFLSFDEAERLISSADAEWKPMVTVAVKTGLRLGELIALRWEDIDLDAGRLMVRRAAANGIVGTPKSGRTREVPLGALPLSVLCVLPRSDSGFVFHAGNQMLTSGQCKWPLWRACLNARTRRIGWHALRHTFASHLVMRGVSLKVVQELLGHSTIEMTMRYSHLSPDVKKDAVKLLDLVQS